MIWIILIVVGFFLIVLGDKVGGFSSNLQDVLQVFGIISMVISIFVLAVTIPIMFKCPQNLEAQYLRLKAEQEYIMSFEVPIKTDMEGKIVIDVANNRLAPEVVSKVIKFYEDAERYNSSYFFWRDHPNFAFWMFFYPNVGREIQRRGLKPIDLGGE